MCRDVEAGGGGGALRAEAKRALDFVEARKQELGQSVGRLSQELDTIAASERTAHVERGAFAAERNTLRQKAWQAWVGAEQVQEFAELNCEAAAQLAKHSDRALGNTAGADLRAEPRGPTAQLRLTEESLKPLQKQLCDFVAKNFFENSEKKALEFLTHVDRETAAPADFFFAGFTSGVCICFAASIGHLLGEGELSWSAHFMFYTYRPAFCIVLAVWLWALNISVFERFGVNHVYVLQTSAEHYLHSSEVVWVAGSWTVLLLCAFWLQASNYVLRYSALLRELPPVAVWVIVLVFFALPTKRFLGTTRRMLQCTLGRVLCAGFFPVIFRDVMTGDILTSMVKPMNDLGHLSCYFYTEIGGLVPIPHGVVNETAFLLEETDGCGCWPGTGWSLHSGGCSVADAENWGHAQETEACGVLMLESANSTLDVDDVEEQCTRYNPWLDTAFALLPFIIRLVQVRFWTEILDDFRRFVDGIWRF